MGPKVLKISLGYGVPKDYPQADKWFREAADQGNTVAQVSLGLSYASGAGVPQDYVLADMWFKSGNSGSFQSRAEVPRYCGSLDDFRSDCGGGADGARVDAGRYFAALASASS